MLPAARIIFSFLENLLPSCHFRLLLIAGLAFRRDVPMLLFYLQKIPAGNVCYSLLHFSAYKRLQLASALYGRRHIMNMISPARDDVI